MLLLLPVVTHGTGYTFPTGQTNDTNLAKYISDLYTFGLAFVGASAFVAILIGAVEYTASGGNTSRQEDAKDRIQSAIYGVILLLFAVIILNTINSRLTELNNPGESAIQQIQSYNNWSGGNCVAGGACGQ